MQKQRFLCLTVLGSEAMGSTLKPWHSLASYPSCCQRYVRANQHHQGPHHPPNGAGIQPGMAAPPKAGNHQEAKAQLCFLCECLSYYTTPRHARGWWLRAGTRSPIVSAAVTTPESNGDLLNAAVLLALLFQCMGTEQKNGKISGLDTVAAKKGRPVSVEKK